MSNADLQNELSRIKNEINRLQRENNQIQGELSALATTAHANSANLFTTSNNARIAMENSHNTIDYSHGQLKRTFNVQLQIKEMYFIFKDVETANKKIRMLNNKLYFDYKNQAMVRKIVRGFVDNLDLQMVSDEIIYKALEKEFLQAPEYWLGYVLLAIMYWKNDNKQKAEQSLQNALERNAKSTAMFFMLFNLKLERIETALNWFNYYKMLDQTGKDNNTFLMFVSSVPNRIHDKEMKDKVGQVLSEYIEQEVEVSSEEVNKNEIVSTILNYFMQIGQASSLKYPKLTQYVNEKQLLASVLSKAKNNQKILDFMEELNKVHLNEKNHYLNKYIDELISVPSEAEQKIIDEIHYNEQIIATMEPLKKVDDDNIFKSDDFRKMAKENYQKRITHDTNKLNVMGEIINWVYVNKNNDVNSLTQWNLFALTKKYTKEAYSNYHNQYKNMLPNSFHIVINDYQSTSDLISVEREINNKNRFIKNKTQRLLKTVKNGGAITSIVMGGLAGIAAIVCLLLSLIGKNLDNSVVTLLKFISVVGLVALVGLLLIGLIKLLVTNPRRRKNIHEKMEKESANLEMILHDLFNEMSEYRTEYQEADKISVYIEERINQM